MTSQEPAFQVGEFVRVLLNEDNKTPREGTIYQITWHHNDKCYYYFINVSGKKISKRYKAEGLDKVK